jgi:hypothetical protein
MDCRIGLNGVDIGLGLATLVTLGILAALLVTWRFGET